MTLNQKDFDQIEEIVEEKIKFLPTKEEFFSKMDEVMGELKAIREEQEIMGHRVSDHEERITTLEEITIKPSIT